MSFSGASDTVSLCVSDQDVESDKLSVVSETDSGVVVCGKSKSTIFHHNFLHTFYFSL